MVSAQKIRLIRSIQPLNEVVDQQQSNWCWAACAAMVLKYKGYKTATQCNIVGAVQGFSGLLSDDPDDVTAALNQVIAFKHGAPASTQGIFVPARANWRQILEQEIQADNPCILFLQGQPVGHAVVCVGLDISPKGFTIWVRDPNPRSANNDMILSKDRFQRLGGFWLFRELVKGDPVPDFMQQ